MSTFMIGNLRQTWISLPVTSTTKLSLGAVTPVMDVDQMIHLLRDRYSLDKVPFAAVYSAPTNEAQRTVSEFFSRREEPIYMHVLSELDPSDLGSLETYCSRTIHYVPERLKTAARMISAIEGRQNGGVSLAIAPSPVAEIVAGLIAGWPPKVAFEDNGEMLIIDHSDPMRTKILPLKLS